jgi:hypothetical protein
LIRKNGRLRQVDRREELPLRSPGSIGPPAATVKVSNKTAQVEIAMI